MIIVDTGPLVAIANDRPLGAVDACVIAVAEKTGATEIATLDAGISPSSDQVTWLPSRCYQADAGYIHSAMCWSSSIPTNRASGSASSRAFA